MIEVKGLEKYYGDFSALKGIDFCVSKGEIVGFLGPNGAGKSTTMKILTGFMYPTRGTVKINSRSVSEHSKETRSIIGYLSENNPLYSEMIVCSYLSFICDMRSIKGRAKKTAIREAIEKTGLEAVAHREINQLSKGFRQRTGLAQALIHDPDVLILDEPTSGLDPNQIVEIRNVLKEIGREKTVILSTHILNEVEQTCGRAIIIDRGKIVADSDLTALKKNVTRSSTVHVTLKYAQSPEHVQKVFSRFGLISEIVAKGSEHSFIVCADGGVDIREKLFKTAVEHEMVILEMNSIAGSLENLFRKITSEQEMC